MMSRKQRAPSLYEGDLWGGKVVREGGRFSPRGWQEKSVQMARLGRNIQSALRLSVWLFDNRHI